MVVGARVADVVLVEDGDGGRRGEHALLGARGRGHRSEQRFEIDLFDVLDGWASSANAGPEPLALARRLHRSRRRLSRGK